MVGVGIEDGEPADAVGPAQVGDGDGDVVKAAVAAEEVPPGVVPSRPDEGEGPGDLPRGDLLRRRDDASDGGPGGASQRIRFDVRNERGSVDEQDQVVACLGTAVEAEPVVLQEVIEGRRELGQPPADGEVALAAEAFVIKNAYTHHFWVYWVYRVCWVPWVSWVCWVVGI